MKKSEVLKGIEVWESGVICQNYPVLLKADQLAKMMREGLEKSPYPFSYLNFLIDQLITHPSPDHQAAIRHLLDIYIIQCGLAADWEDEL